MPDLGLPLDGEFYPTQNMGPAKSAVIFLHGYGANGLDLINIGAYLSKVLPDTVFYAPDGPEECDLTPFGRQWFSLETTDPEMYRRDPRALPKALESMHRGVLQAAPILNTFIDAVMERHELTSDKVALFGFSQGTMMGLHVGLNRPEPVAGIFGFSGALTGPDALPVKMQNGGPFPPVWLVHGAADDVLPPQSLGFARDALAKIGITAKTHIRPASGHEIDDAGLFIARDGLLDVLG